jgi:hypothetical protein
MKHLISAILITLAAPLVHATEVCESSAGVQTPYGKYNSTDCAVDGHRSRSFVSLGGQKILEDEDLFKQDRSDNKSIWIYKSGKLNLTTGCKPNLYLIDISKQPVKVLSFGIKNACNEFEWASWSEKRSVIALKHNAKFIYENGKLIPPEKGEKLWKAIEPPHGGPGLAVEDAIPFVEEVPPPK